MRTLLLLLFAASAAGAAESTEARLREALRSTTQQLRALEEERSSWRTTEAQTRKETDALREKLAAATKAKGRGEGRKERELSQRLAEQLEASARLTESLSQCRRDAEQAAHEQETARTQLAARLEGISARATSCEAKNTRMYQVGKDVLDWLTRVGVGAALMAREPFLGLKRVELENIAQDYQDKLLGERVGR